MACGSRHDEVLSADPQPVLFNGAEVAVPQGVDAELWRSLCAELECVLEQQGTVRQTAGVPIGKGSIVPDLHTWEEGGGSAYGWSYRQHGDYNLDGNVNIGDLALVGINFGKSTTAADWQKAQLADGDYSGIVGITDVAAIGLNFNGRVDGYELHWRQSSSEPWAKLAGKAFIAGDPSTGQYPQYVVYTVYNAPGPDFQVLPYCTINGDYYYGEPSNMIGELTMQGTTWNTAGGNPSHDGCALFYGPANPDDVWVYNLGGAGSQSIYNEPVSDYTGNIYIGVSQDSTLIETNPGVFFALTPDGELRWSFQTSRGVCSTASCYIDGRVVVGDLGGSVYCLAPDGKQRWRRQLSGMIMLNAPLLDSTGNLYIVTQTPLTSDEYNSTLYKLDINGAIVWSRDLGCECLDPPIFDGDNDVAVVSSEGMYIAYTAAGDMWFKYDTGSIPDADSYHSGQMYRGGMVYYATNNKAIWQFAYDHSSVNQISLGNAVPVTMPRMDMLGNIAIGSLDSAVLKLKYFTGGTLAWDVTLPGDYMNDVVFDLNTRMYMTTCLMSGDPAGCNGVHYIWPDQTKSWFYSTGDVYPFKLALVGDHQLACMALSSEGMQLISIKGT